MAEMKSTVHIASYILIAFRFWLVVGMICSRNVSAVLLGLIGLIAVITTIAAWSEGEPDLSWTGLAVGVGHLAVLLFSPGQIHWTFVAPIFWTLVVIQTWAKWHLGRRCTVTGPVWVNLVATGPYAIVRHPMTATELLIACTFALEFPSVWNGCVLLFVIASKFVITLLEEKFLKGEPTYRDYVGRVRWRFFPGIW